MPSWLRGPRLTLVIAAALVAMVATLLAASGWTEPGLRLLIRATARTSIVLFLAAFLASTLCRRWPGPATVWLLQNRRYVGLGFAVSHLLHLLAIVELHAVAPAAFADIPWVTLIVGSGGFVMVGIMAATSSDAAVGLLGASRWRNLHRFGLYYLWIVFAFTYLHTNLVVTAVLAVALGVRLRGGHAGAAAEERRG